MGAINFSYDSVLDNTFGSKDDSIKDEIENKLQSIDISVYKPVISQGYYEGFVIHSQAPSLSLSYNQSSYDHMIDEMVRNILANLERKFLLADFIDRTHTEIEAHQSNNTDEPTRSIEAIYIYTVLDSATEDEESYAKLLLNPDVIGKLVEPLENAGITIHLNDEPNDDVEELKDSIIDVLSYKFLKTVVEDALDDDINNLDIEIAKIAKQYKLKHLVGQNWTSGLADADYDKIFKRLLDAKKKSESV